jgi:hypothetical protein
MSAKAGSTQYLPLSMVRARIAERFTLEDIDYRTGGPAGPLCQGRGNRRTAGIHHPAHP